MHTIRQYILQETDYRGSHAAPTNDGYCSPLYDVTLNGTYPEDVYSHNAARYYGDGFSYDNQSASIIQSLRGKPNAPVAIYRAIPAKDIEEMSINPGDWVSINKRYAINHGQRQFDKEYKILSLTVRAKDVWTDGNSLHEQGYDPS